MTEFVTSVGETLFFPLQLPVGAFRVDLGTDFDVLCPRVFTGFGFRSDFERRSSKYTATGVSSATGTGFAAVRARREGSCPLQLWLNDARQTEHGVLVLPATPREQHLFEVRYRAQSCDPTCRGRWILATAARGLHSMGLHGVNADLDLLRRLWVDWIDATIPHVCESTKVGKALGWDFSAEIGMALARLGPRERSSEFTTDTLEDLAYWMLRAVDDWIVGSLGLPRLDTVAADESLDEHPLVIAEKHRQLDSLDSSIVSDVERLSYLATLDMFSRT